MHPPVAPVSKKSIHSRSLIESIERRLLLSAAPVRLPGAPLTLPELAVHKSPGGSAHFALSSLPLLSSRVGAPHTLFLDFDGAPAFDWHNRDASGTLLTTRVHGPGGDNVAVPALSMDANSNDYTQAELDLIRDIWLHVAEKYSPFNVNVTTVDPGALVDGQSQRVLIGGSNADWYTGGGGVASIGSYNESDEDNTSFAWVKEVGVNFATSPAYVRHFIGDSAAHEAGHTLGLLHVRHNLGGGSIQEYYTGDGTHAPIMGGGSNAFAGVNGNANTSRTLWWLSGLYGQSNPDSSQFDAAILNSVLGNAPDDLPGGSTKLLSLDNVNGDIDGNNTGIIETILDVDRFRINALGPIMSLTVRNAAIGGMLRPKITLIDSTNNAVISTATATDVAASTATINVTGIVPGRQYYVDIGGATGIGDLGQYRISGNAGTFISYNAAISTTITVRGYAGQNNNIKITYDEISGSYLFRNDVAGGTVFQSVGAAPSITAINATLIGVNDAITVASATTVPINFTANSGFDSLVIDDRNSGKDLYRASITPTSIFREDFDESFYSVTFSGAKSLTYYGPGEASEIEIFGTASSILSGQQTTIIGNSFGDSFIVHPHTATGVPTIPTPLGIGGGGGADTLVIDDSINPNNETWTINNLFGAGTQNFGYTGSAGMGSGSDLEKITLLGGSANDTYNIANYSSGTGLALLGGEGDDTCNYGTTNASSQVTLMSSFNFDGQGGYDTFNFNNQNTTATFTYTKALNNLSASSTVGHGYSLSEFNNELVRINDGNQPGTFRINAIESGQRLELYGAGAIDGVDAGYSTSTLDAIQGPIYYDGGTDGGNMLVRASSNATPDIVHLDSATLGAYAGDNLFGVGGSLTFSNLTNFGAFPGITLNLGTAADTVYAMPLAAARVTINGNSPSAAPGDTLTIAAAHVVSRTQTGNPASGSLSGANVQTLNWTGFEGSVAVDAVAPTALTAVYQYDLPVPTLDVVFNENVGSQLVPGSLLVTNVTTGQPIASTDQAFNYDAGTNTLHITFPGLPNDVLADGNYTVVVPAGGIVDVAGNPSKLNTSFPFFSLAGDANHDRLVNFDDLLILAQSYGLSGKTFSQGNYNYSADGLVDFDDLLIVAQRYGTSLPALVQTPASPRRRSGAVAQLPIA